MTSIHELDDDDSDGYISSSVNVSVQQPSFPSESISSRAATEAANDDMASESSKWDRKSLGRCWRSISNDEKSKRILGFLLLNLSFAFVELFYGFWSNSLSLISDSCHMFFDCSALLCSLAAALISKWKSNESYSYGYGRAEILSGFVNGLFLLFVAFFILSEAIERILTPPEIHHERILFVSVVGLCVNLIGIFIFQHGHSHHAHSHRSDSPSGYHMLLNEDEQLACVSTEQVTNVDDITVKNDIQHRHPHHHHHHHGHNHSHEGGRDQIFRGVLLHILADTLGSIGVIISALLMNEFGWLIADPICSIFISFLVVISTYPLLRDSTAILMQRTPNHLESRISATLSEIGKQTGIPVKIKHFWTLSTDNHIGSIRLQVKTDQELKKSIYLYETELRKLGVKELFIHIDFIDENTSQSRFTLN